MTLLKYDGWEGPIVTIKPWNGDTLVSVDYTKDGKKVGQDVALGDKQITDYGSIDALIEHCSPAINASIQSTMRLYE